MNEFWDLFLHPSHNLVSLLMFASQQSKVCFKLTNYRLFLTPEMETPVASSFGLDIKHKPYVVNLGIKGRVCHERDLRVRRKEEKEQIYDRTTKAGEIKLREII